MTRRFVPKRTGILWFVLIGVGVSVVGGLGLPPALAATISFVQVNAATPQTPQTTVAVTYPAAQAAGDLNIVVVGWNDATRLVSSVTDTKSNVYSPAVGLTVNSAGGLSQMIYYAKNIAAAPAGGNTVTVTFNGPATFPDIRILEYSGADVTAPVDVTATGTGNSVSSSTAAVTTTNANDLLFAANTVATLTSAAGAGFTSRVITYPDGDIAEDRLVTATGSYSAAASLNAAGPWVMQMVAFRGAGGTPPPSDTTPPTAPSSLTASPASSSQINLAWTASTDNVGVTAYQVERCQGAGCSSFAQIATPAATTFNDTGLAASTSYSYRVRAADAAANVSTYSNTASASTQAPPLDTTPPTAPSNLTATPASSTQINLAWTASTDNVGVTAYQVERCQGAGCSSFAQIAAPAATAFNDAGLTASTSYSYRVRATDAAANPSPYSNTAGATTLAAPPPTATITFVQVNAATPQTPQTTVAVTYPAAQAAGDLNIVVVGWNDATRLVSSVTDSKSNVYSPAVGLTVNSAGGLSQMIYYAKNITAAPAGGNTVTVTFNGPATFPDIRILEYSGADVTAPVDVTATGTGNSASSSTAAVTTTNANDLLFAANTVATQTSAPGAGFTSRVITNPDGDIAEDRLVTATGSYSAAASLNAAGPWVMQMVAFRGAAGTPPPPDTTPPTAPSNLTATPGSTQINLAWTASTDNVGVTGYRVERCQGAGCSDFAQIATPGATAFSDTGLTPSTSYSYRVRAVDAASNPSPYSNTAGATTLTDQRNPIAIENQQPGTGEWQLGDFFGRPYATDAKGQIKGYASATSVNKGGTITFYVSVNPAQTYTIDVYRLGWYQGLGGRLMQHIGPLNGTRQTACPRNATTGMVLCSWTPVYNLAVQTSWTSGIYVAVLKNAQLYHNYIVFAVRDDSRVAALLYQQPVTTYQAYNNYPNGTGKSLYEYNSAGANTVAGTPRAVKVSFDRPYADEGVGDIFWLGEINILRWLEMSGYDVTYSTDVDTHANGGRLLNYRGFLSVGHDEYWSKPMYDAAVAARDAGVNLAFFGANAVYWQVRFEPSSSGVPNRVLVCYKDAAIDPVADRSLKTVNWRDDPVNRPEQTLIGVQYTSQEGTWFPYVVRNSGSWVYAGTGFKDGDSVPEIVGYEADRSFSEYPQPNAVSGTYTLLSNSPYVDLKNNSDHANSSVYQAPSGAWVFGAGTMAWTWTLDDYNPPGTQSHAIDTRMQRTTANILDRFVGN